MRAPKHRAICRIDSPAPIRSLSNVDNRDAPTPPPPGDMRCCNHRLNERAGQLSTKIYSRLRCSAFFCAGFRFLLPALTSLPVAVCRREGHFWKRETGCGNCIRLCGIAACRCGRVEWGWTSGGGDRPVVLRRRDRGPGTSVKRLWMANKLCGSGGGRVRPLC